MTPTTMKAAVATAAGARYLDVPVPRPKPNEILVRVRAASLNRADLVGLSNGGDKVIGMEWAGEVVELGSEAQGYAVGDRVMCTGAGAYAEYAVTDWGRAFKIPSASLGFEEATVLTLALQAMHDALVTHGELKRGQSVLIHGATSGVGLMALQIARELGASVVIGTSTHADKRPRILEAGATHAVESTDEGWVAKAMEATQGRGVDVTVDMVGGPRFNQVMEAAALSGRIVNVGRLGGVNAQVDLNLHSLKRLTYVGVTFRTRSVEEVREVNRLMLADLGPALAAGRLRLPIDARFPLAEAAQALARMTANQHFGKIVLSV
ncbi:MAG: Quinone oxidoreductase [Variovorax sp.]|nr:Quinone oxidoreductase [Variovorax sp.]